MANQHNNVDPMQRAWEALAAPAQTQQPQPPAPGTYPPAPYPGYGAGPGYRKVVATVVGRRTLLGRSE